MSDLVPQAAVIAVIRVTRLDEMGGAFEDEGEYMSAILNAAAPHIAAHALRLAAEAYADFNFGQWETDRVKHYLTHRANEIEAAAAFTDMVQLGQEIERGNG